MNPPPRLPLPAQVPPQWRWHYQRLQSIRSRLTAQHRTEMAQVTTPLEAGGGDPGDSASDEADHDLALGILSQEEEALGEVDAAIRRILEGGYGLCEETGQPIPAARLRAVPWTRFIREVEERLEREGRDTP